MANQDGSISSSDRRSSSRDLQLATQRSNLPAGQVSVKILRWFLGNQRSLPGLIRTPPRAIHRVLPRTPILSACFPRESWTDCTATRRRLSRAACRESSKPPGPGEESQSISLVITIVVFLTREDKSPETQCDRRTQDGNGLQPVRESPADHLGSFSARSAVLEASSSPRARVLVD